jgi:4-aminobutyrate aminotransferase-like enzyme
MASIGINGTPEEKMTLEQKQVEVKQNPLDMISRSKNEKQNAKLYASAEKHLLTFGCSFSPDVIVKTSGMYLYTASGRKIMDWTSGQMSCLVGHGHPEIVQAIAEHAANLDHLYSGMISPPVIELGEKLVGLLPKGLDKAMFLSTGGESNECAIKLAKNYTGKFEIVGLGASWHGVTSGANGAQYHAGRRGYGPVVRLVSSLYLL